MDTFPFLFMCVLFLLFWGFFCICFLFVCFYLFRVPRDIFKLSLFFKALFFNVFCLALLFFLSLLFSNARIESYEFSSGYCFVCVLHAVILLWTFPSKNITYRFSFYFLFIFRVFLNLKREPFFQSFDINAYFKKKFFLAACSENVSYIISAFCNLLRCSLCYTLATLFVHVPFVFFCLFVCLFFCLFLLFLWAAPEAYCVPRLGVE